MLDYLIKGGTIVDGGTGASAPGDVGVREVQIVAVGMVKESAETIDTDGAIVAPEFLDLHTYYDGRVACDDLEPSAGNGVSTGVKAFAA